MEIRHALRAAPVLILLACTSVGVTQTKTGIPAKRSNCPLDVYTTDSEVTRPFEVVCLIDSRTGTTLFHSKTAAAAIEHTRPYACECGADAIVLMSADTEGLTWATWGRGKAIVKAIRYLPNPSAETSTTPKP